MLQQQLMQVVVMTMMTMMLQHSTDGVSYFLSHFFLKDLPTIDRRIICSMGS